ncbi:hypothetical protein ACFX2K_027769 [Malus domestica]
MEDEGEEKGGLKDDGRGCRRPQAGARGGSYEDSDFEFLGQEKARGSSWGCNNWVKYYSPVCCLSSCTKEWSS